ncbi:F-box/kelch-repeat protein At2g43270-like [Apium graveolens]|uniref:F-box/kelch-repeat protein At2g43270-like n=1 Tax=Apium graveolens TaxID=4045 RepID=UPI003D79416D
MFRTMRSRYYMHEDVIFMILSWLPAKSLLRFMAVCKLWHSIILNPYFINTHLTNSQKKQALVAILSEEVDPDCIYTLEESIRLKLPPQCTGMTHSTGSCNGLVCLTNAYGVDIYLWNPFTKRLKKLPTPNKIQYPKRIKFSNIGLGFDSISNDYKILRMVEFSFGPLDRLGNRILEVEVYSSNADSWKEIPLPETVRSIMLHKLSKCIQAKNGVLYIEGIREILSFDLHNEVFGVYPFPNSIKKSHVLNFEDSVAMICKSFGDVSRLSLWTLDDNCGCKASWNKKFDIENNWHVDYVCLMLGVGQFVGNIVTAGGYFLYDYKKKDIKRLCDYKKKNIRLVSKYLAIIMVKYVESLVSLKGFEKEELSGK